METFAENLAHFSHGMAFLFFIVWTVRLFPLRRRNNMLKILFFGMAYMAFIEAKDTVYLADENWFSGYVTWLSVIADLPIVPILALFFFEAISPGYVTWTKASIVMLPFVCFIASYIIWGESLILYVALAYTALTGVAAAVWAKILSARRTRVLKDNLSEIESVSLRWAAEVMCILLVLLISWSAIIWADNWLVDALFYIVSIIIWSYVLRISIKHGVMGLQPTADDMQEEAVPDMEPALGLYAERLNSSMEEDRLFLNPKLTLTETAAVIGTNRTYLSRCINNELGTTFYDYVNGFRVREACRLMEEDGSRTLAEIAELSGFNSLSTFNRAFSRHSGCTPSSYLKQVSTPIREGSPDIPGQRESVRLKKSGNYKKLLSLCVWKIKNCKIWHVKSNSL